MLRLAASLKCSYGTSSERNPAEPQSALGEAGTFDGSDSDAMLLAVRLGARETAS